MKKKGYIVLSSCGDWYLKDDNDLNSRAIFDTKEEAEEKKRLLEKSVKMDFIVQETEA